MLVASQGRVADGEGDPEVPFSLAAIGAASDPLADPVLAAQFRAGRVNGAGDFLENLFGGPQELFAYPGIAACQGALAGGSRD